MKSVELELAQDDEDPHSSLSGEDTARLRKILRMAKVHSRIDTALGCMSDLYDESGLGAEAEYVLLTGKPGVGKTTALRIFEAERPPRQTASGWVRPVVRIGVPPGSRFADVIDDGLRALVAHRLIVGNEGTRRAAFLNELREQKVKVLVLDECQHFIFNRTDKYAGKATDLLKEILNSNVCQLVFAGTPEAAGITELIGTGTQFARRARDHFEIEPFDWYADEDREELKDLLDEIDEEIPFELKTGFGALAEQFHMAGEGAFGRMMKLIARAAREAMRDGARFITVDHLDFAHRRKYPRVPFFPFSGEANPRARMENDPDEETGLRSRGRRRKEEFTTR